MGRINGETIIEALKVIQKVCNDNISEDNGECKYCPFEVNGVCAIRDLNPCNWKVSDFVKFQALE